MDSANPTPDSPSQPGQLSPSQPAGQDPLASLRADLVRLRDELSQEREAREDESRRFAERANTLATQVSDLTHKLTEANERALRAQRAVRRSVANTGAKRLIADVDEILGCTPSSLSLPSGTAPAALPAGPGPNGESRPDDETT